MASLILVDDNDDFRHSTAWWLEAEGYQVHEFASGESAWSILQNWPPEERPACLLLDVRMPALSGPELHERLLQASADEPGAAPWPVIYLTGHGEVPLAVEAMQRGAITFLEKPFHPQALLSALAQVELWKQRAAAGAVGPLQAGQEANRSARPAGTPRLDDLDLSTRERQVLAGLSRGLTNKAMGQALSLSHKTIELHRSRLMGKFGVRLYHELLGALIARGWTPGTVIEDGSGCARESIR